LLVRSREAGGRIELFQPAQSVSETAHAEADETELGMERSAEETDWTKLLHGGGELFAAVERASSGAHQEFTRPLFGVRVELGDDYPFIDPTQSDFDYEGGLIKLTKRPTPAAFVNGLTECLRRVVNKIASGPTEMVVREQVAVELAIASRQEADAVAPFAPHLDRIAGRRVV
jgi:hypothetical protein